MDRRDVLRALATTGALVSLDGCRRPPRGEVPDANLEAAVVELTGKPLEPGQAAGVRKALATMRFTGEVDPEVQPSLLFDPEVDVE